MPFHSPFQTIIPIIINPLNSKVMNNKKKNEGQTDFSYYGLYLLDYLRTNKFEQADDTAFIRERADRAAETYERARLEGYPADGAQELAMDTLLRGLHYSRYAIKKLRSRRNRCAKIRSKQRKKTMPMQYSNLIVLT